MLDCCNGLTIVCFLIYNKDKDLYIFFFMFFILLLIIMLILIKYIYIIYIYIISYKYNEYLINIKFINFYHQYHISFLITKCWNPKQYKYIYIIFILIQNNLIKELLKQNICYNHNLNHNHNHNIEINIHLIIII